MSAASVIIPKGIPIFMVGHCGTSPEALNVVISKTVPATIQIMNNYMEAFQTLIIKERGILVVEINELEELKKFAMIFQASIKHLKLSEVKIIVISDQQEIVLSRSLTQFTFVRTTSPFRDVKRFGAVLVRDYREIETRSMRKSQQINVANSEIIIIKGGDSDKSFQQTKDKSNKPTNPLHDCVGNTIPSFLYDTSCTWRVRGHFTAFEEKTSAIVFKADDSRGAEQLVKALTESPYLISSTSATRARVCMTLDFVGRNLHQFIFKTPTMVQEVQRRADPRLRITDDYPVVCQFFDPVLKMEIALSVLDISAGGIGARMDQDLIKNYTLEQHIGDVSIIFSQRVVKIKAAEVRHFSRSDVMPDFKILGLQFLEVDPKDKAFIEMYIESGSTIVNIKK